MATKKAKPKLFLSDDEFREFFEREIALTEKVVDEQRPTSLLPRLTVIGHEGPDSPCSVRVFSLAMPLTDAKEKQRIFASLGVRCYKQEKVCPLAAFFTCEAWCSRQRAGAPSIQPSKDPAREEAVIVFGRTIDGRDCMAVAPIFRDSGNVIRLGKFERSSGETHSYLLVTFFNAFLRTGYDGTRGLVQ